jgi:hypothetical protein
MFKGNPFRFVSLALLTQGVLLLNQIVLLPFQIRIWGTEAAAYWYSTVALASLTTAADFGLRTAGHAEFIRYSHDPSDEQARIEFQHLWDWMRILIFSSLVALVALDFGHHRFFQVSHYPLWRPALVIGIALETLLIVRMMYMDSLGLYTEAEGGYLLLAAGRLGLAVGALIIFHAPPATLGWIWFFAGVLAVAQQSWLCRHIKVLQLFAPISRGLSVKTLAIARHTMADPSSNWMRFNAPVLVLAAIAQPTAVTTYVALRAVFGAARATISQLSRFASVDYIRLTQACNFTRAEIQVTLCVLLTAFAGSVVGVFVVADNFRIASIWLVHANPQLYQAIAVMFALGSAFSSYQLMLALMLRCGEVDRIARRQYLYILYAAVFAVVALITRSTLLWLVMLLVADLMISLSFLLKTSRGGVQSQTAAGIRGCLAATASSVLIMAMWLTVRLGNFGFLKETTVSAIAPTAGFLLLWLCLIGLVYLYLLRDVFVKTKSFPGVGASPLAGVDSVQLQK